MTKLELRTQKLAELDQMLQTDPTALNYQLRSESVISLKALINKVAAIADLDEEKVARRVNVTSKSPYGKVCGLLNLLTAIVLWPVDGSDGSGIADIKEEIVSELSLDEELLIDIKEAKGFHTFLNDDYDVVAGVEPDFEEYNMLVRLFCQTKKIPVVDFKLTQSKWLAAEAKAVERAKLDQEEAAAELVKFEALNGEVA